MERTYTTREAIRLAGITYRQADYWARTGLLRPSVADADGSGSRRLYSRADVVAMCVIGALAGAYPIGRLDLDWLPLAPLEPGTRLVIRPDGTGRVTAAGDPLEAGDLVALVVNLDAIAVRLDLADALPGAEYAVA